MACLSFPNVSVVGLSACVPKQIDDNRLSPYIPTEERATLVESIGIFQKRISPKDITTSDLCYNAAERLIEDMQISKDEIQALVFVSQTPDYILPATACILQDRLGLSKDCLAFDINLGCSGWIYGMASVSALVSSGNIKKALLLVGDINTRFCTPLSKSEWPLFGDAGTCTMLSYNKDRKNIFFHLGTDGSGYESIIIPDGGCRHPFSEKSLEYHNVWGGKLNNLQTHMDGMSVFSFAISKGPKSIKTICDTFNISLNDVDIVALHQANKLITEKISKKLKLEKSQVPISMDEFGNTSGASIPLTLVTRCKNELRNHNKRILASAFGVGLSWGSCYFETEQMTISELIEI